MNKLLTQRDERIDILRAIAMIGILIAHSHPGPFLNQLRNFDVVLMVLLLGTSFFISTNNKKVPYAVYLKKRFVRLVIPTWTFLVLFLALFFVVSIILGDSFYFSIGTIIGYFTLTSNWYVWIIRVFVIIALISPFLLFLSNKIKNNIVFMVFLAASYGMYFIFVILNDQVFSGSGAVKRIYENCFLYGFGFGLIAMLGMRLKKFNPRELTILTCLFGLIYLLLAIRYNFTPTQEFKYPPQLYYISYGLFGSLVLYLLLSLKSVYRMFNNAFIKFISHTSMWLYLWHIIPVTIIELFSDSLPVFQDSALIRFVFIFSIALLLTYAQETIKNFNKKRKIAPTSNVNLQ